MIKKIFTAIVIVNLSTWTFTQAMIDEQVDSNRVDYCFNALPAQFYHDKVEEFCVRELNPIMENQAMAISYIQQLYNVCKSLISVDQETQKISFISFIKAKVVYEKYLTYSNIPDMIQQRDRHSPCRDIEEVSDISGISMKSGFSVFYQHIACEIATAISDIVNLSIRASITCSSEIEEESSQQYKQYIEKLRFLQACTFQAKLQEFHEKDFCALHLLHTQRFLAMVLRVVK